jgi:deoxyribonuclease-2
MNVSALDENGREVEWWFASKVLKLTMEASTPRATGYEYIYYDPSICKVVKSPNLLIEVKSALDLTLDSIFAKPDATTGRILYNDELPAGAKHEDSGRFGHTKGVIAFDTASKTALWLLHSWTKYADPQASDPEKPTPMYGQTFLCISLDMTSAIKIAEQLGNHQEPHVYLPQIPASLDKNDALYLLTQTLPPDTPGDSDAIDCKSRGGLAFKVIAKDRKWGKDFWIDLVRPTIGADMDVEARIRGKIPPMLDSDGIHKTLDVK